MVGAEQTEELVLQQIGDLFLKLFIGLALTHGEHPSVQSVLESMDRAMGIAILVGLLVMEPVNAYPVYGGPHETEIATGDNNVFEPGRHFQRLMGEQTVIAERHSQTMIEKGSKKPQNKGNSYHSDVSRVTQKSHN